MFSSQRVLSFLSIGTRVGLIFFLSALQPLNSLRVQNFMAVRPSGSPAVVTALLSRLARESVRSEESLICATTLLELPLPSRRAMSLERQILLSGVWRRNDFSQAGLNS